MATETLLSASPLALCIQPACLEHKYIRHSNSSHIFERPERIRAVLLGFAAALARIEALDDSPTSQGNGNGNGDDLSTMLSSLSIRSPTSAFLPPVHLVLPPPPTPPTTPGQVLLHHPALQVAHSTPEESPLPYLPRSRGAALPSSTYLKDLLKWASEAKDMIRTTGCEIPPDLGLNPGDLYLGPGSILAIEGSVQTVCQAVDGVCALPKTQLQEDGSRPGTPIGTATPTESSYSKAFCAIRPPGHHCGEDAPSGFCYINNVVVGAMHAYLQHDIDRAIIIDFDLHHGNGTQALVMPLNAATYAEDLAMKAGKPPTDMRGRKGVRRGWKGFYGSVHDIYSYPCEDGDLDLIKDASLSLAAHGQYIENIHLQPYESEDDFYKRIYPLYSALLEKAKMFMNDTHADPERTVVFISAGFDACEHEHQGMQRHDRRVPASFYSRYTRDIVTFADKYAGGKVISVLEGGYGDRALTSAAMGHAIGLMGREGVPDWWAMNELELLEKATKKRRKGKLGALPADLASNAYMARTHALLAHFEGTPPSTPAPSVNATPAATGRMTLRERRRPPMYDDSPTASPREPARRKPIQQGPASAANTPVKRTTNAEPLVHTAPPQGVKADHDPLIKVDLNSSPTPGSSSFSPVERPAARQQADIALPDLASRNTTTVIPPSGSSRTDESHVRDTVQPKAATNITLSPSVVSDTMPSPSTTSSQSEAGPPQPPIMLKIRRTTPFAQQVKQEPLSNIPPPVPPPSGIIPHIPHIPQVPPPIPPIPPVVPHPRMYVPARPESFSTLPTHTPVAPAPPAPLPYPPTQQPFQTGPPIMFRPTAMEPVVLPPTPQKPSNSNPHDVPQEKRPMPRVPQWGWPRQQPAQPQWPPSQSSQ